jgi:V/A-type H+-transporting ATPase subunit E
MNGINKITDRIAAETQGEINAVRAEAEAKCREIIASYEKQAQDEYERLIREGTEDGALQTERLKKAAVMEAKKSVLTMKQEAVDKVLEASVKRICDMPEERYITFLAKLASEAAFTGTEEVIFNRRDCKSGTARAVVAKANELLKKRGILPKLTVSSENGSFSGGIIVKQGDIEVNCCVETLVEMSRDRLAAEIAGALFDE